jgi:hypothetical protein
MVVDFISYLNLTTPSTSVPGQFSDTSKASNRDFYRMKRSGYIKKITATILLLGQVALVPTIPSISKQDHLDLSAHYSALAKEAAQSVLTLSGVKNPSVSASATLEFDEEKLKQDAQAWFGGQLEAAAKKSQSNSSEAQTNFSKLLQLAADEQKKRDVEIRKDYEILREKERIASEEASRRAIEAAKLAANPQKTAESKKKIAEQERIRMGILNIGSDQIDFKEPEEKLPETPVTNIFPVTSVVVPPQGAPLSIGINSSPYPESELTPFTFKAADYLTRVNVTLVLGSDVPEALVTNIVARVDASLNLGKISGGGPTADWITVEKVVPEPAAPPPPIAGPKDFFKGLWGPGNFFVSAIAMAIVLGIFVLISALVTSMLLKNGIQKATSTLGQGISSLKPAPEVDEEGEARVRDDGERSEDEADPVVLAAQAEASNHATTAELGNIREQLTKLIEAETYACAEVIKDIFYESTGFTDFRDLVVFVGYSSLRPVIDLLPKSTVEKMLGFVEENKDVQPNILNGAKISQAVYSEVIAKVSFKSAEAKLLEPIKEVLIRIEDNVLDAFIRQANSMEVALLLRSLTNERSTRAVQNLQPEILKEALDLLGADSSTWSRLIPDLIRKISITAEKITVKSLAHQRLILKLVKNASLDQEDLIYELIPATDFELKRQIIKTKLLFRDIKYVPNSLLDRAFSKIPVKVRAQLILASDDELKNQFYRIVVSGTRKAEVLQAEISQLERSEKRMAEIRQNRSALFSDLMFEIRAIIADENQWIDQILKAQSEDLNLGLPEEGQSFTAA